ncbi:MAG: alpha/beta hydrolase [Desulfoprunum sp.]|nr:alpha/beta hydrolase [Desulfoprunum sp.]
MNNLKFVSTELLEIGYLEFGQTEKDVIVLLHGFPYDVNAYAGVWPILSSLRFRVLVPFLRGYGSTRFLNAESMRSGEQAALGTDLVAFLDKLDIDKAFLAGYDWGGRAACIMAALHPERVRGLVSGGGYNIQRIEGALNPLLPEVEQRYWYQYYLHGERGRRGLEKYRKELCRVLWQDWSPRWSFDETTFAKTAESYENSDFVEVIVHSYRHRFGLVEGDARYETVSQSLELLPSISVPTIAIEGTCDGVTPAGSYSHLDGKFVGRFERRLLENVGHNIPQEDPEGFSRAILDLTVEGLP